MVYIYDTKKECWGWINKDGWVIHNYTTIGRLERNHAKNGLIATGTPLTRYISSVDAYGNVYNSNLTYVYKISKGDALCNSHKEFGYAYGFWDWYQSLLNEDSSSSSSKDTKPIDMGTLIFLFVGILLLPHFFKFLNLLFPTPQVEQTPIDKTKYYIDYSIATNTENYKEGKNCYFKYSYVPSMYDSFSSSANGFQQNKKKGQEMIHMYRVSSGKFQKDMTYDEKLSCCISNIIYEAEDIHVLQEISCEDSYNGNSYLFLKGKKSEEYSLYYAVVSQDNGVVYMKVCFHNPRTEEEKKEMNNYIETMCKNCDFIGDVYSLPF